MGMESLWKKKGVKEVAFGVGAALAAAEVVDLKHHADEAAQMGSVEAASTMPANFENKTEGMSSSDSPKPIVIERMGEPLQTIPNPDAGGKVAIDIDPLG